MPPRKKKTIPRPVHLETTIPSIRSCARCGVWLAAGVAEGLKAQVEFTALDPGQQLWAILNHIELYAIRRSGLVLMEAWRFDDLRYQVRYPRHRCDVKWPTVLGPRYSPRKSDIPPY